MYNSNRQIIGNGVVVGLTRNEPSSSRCYKDQVLTAEILLALNIVDKNYSFQSADGNKHFVQMFPDSQIAKLKYMIQFGIAPCIKSMLMEDAKDQQYCFHFDEMTTSQVKKQYDGYITYYSENLKEITTSYVGSLFVGHCLASDLLEHFFHFIEDLQLNLDNLLNVGRDEPNVNKKLETDLHEELENNKN